MKQKNNRHETSGQVRDEPGNSQQHPNEHQGNEKTTRRDTKHPDQQKGIRRDDSNMPMKEEDTLGNP